MGFLDFFKKKKRSLSEDVVKGYEWIAQALISSGYKADFSLESLKEVDRFFDDNVVDGRAKKGGVLSKGTGMKVFAVGSYVGEVLRRECKGEWVVCDDDPEGEMNIEVLFSNDSRVMPVRKVMKRFKNGDEDALYSYAIFHAEIFKNEY